MLYSTGRLDDELRASLQGLTRPAPACSVEELDADAAGLVEQLNLRRPPSKEPVQILSPLPGKSRSPMYTAKTNRPWHETVDDSDEAARHLEKYRSCGPICMDLTRIYYRQDFDLLQYPEALQKSAGA